MNLRALGEDRVVRELWRGTPAGTEVIAGPGDDCAVLGRPRDRRWRLLKTECLVAGVHFLPTTPPRWLGRKLLARALSDFAAMGGGEPQHALITLGVPPTAPLKNLRAIYAGFAALAREFGVGLVGGETSRTTADGMFLVVMLAGEIERRRCVFRAGGRPGDALYVTGKLGGSIAGHHLKFTPRLVEARWLTAHFHPSAMMDLSDGLGADLPRLGAASGVGFEIDPGALPRRGRASIEQAWSDGEDYELLFAIPPSARLERLWRATFPAVPLTRIGQLVADPNSRAGAPARAGHDHFASR